MLNLQYILFFFSQPGKLFALFSQYVTAFSRYGWPTKCNSLGWVSHRGCRNFYIAMTHTLQCHNTAMQDLWPKMVRSVDQLYFYWKYSRLASLHISDGLLLHDMVLQKSWAVQIPESNLLQLQCRQTVTNVG